MMGHNFSNYSYDLLPVAIYEHICNMVYWYLSAFRYLVSRSVASERKIFVRKQTFLTYTWPPILNLIVILQKYLKYIQRNAVQ